MKKSHNTTIPQDRITRKAFVEALTLAQSLSRLTEPLYLSVPPSKMLKSSALRLTVFKPTLSPERIWEKAPMVSNNKGSTINSPAK